MYDNRKTSNSEEICRMRQSYTWLNHRRANNVHGIQDTLRCLSIILQKKPFSSLIYREHIRKSPWKPTVTNIVTYRRTESRISWLIAIFKRKSHANVTHIDAIIACKHFEFAFTSLRAIWAVSVRVSSKTSGRTTNYTAKNMQWTSVKLSSFIYKKFDNVHIFTKLTNENRTSRHVHRY